VLVNEEVAQLYHHQGLNSFVWDEKEDEEEDGFLKCCCSSEEGTERESNWNLGIQEQLE
jgi:hypothetical protein